MAQSKNTDLKGAQMGRKWKVTATLGSEREGTYRISSVLANLDKETSHWNSSLGDAYVNQQQEVK